MISEVVLCYALNGLLGITLFALCRHKRNPHPSLKGDPITPLPGNTPSVYFQLPTNQSAYGSVMQDPKASKNPKDGKDSKDSKDKEPTPKKAEKSESKERSVSKEDPLKESKMGE